MLALFDGNNNYGITSSCGALFLTPVYPNILVHCSFGICGNYP